MRFSPRVSRRRRRGVAVGRGPVPGLVVIWLAALAASAQAQILPSDPIRLAGGRLVISGEATASVATSDDQGFFNYTDYEHNALRLVRLGVSAAWRLGARVAVLGEARTENWGTLQPYALYVRVRPWRQRTIDIQAGRIPPIFGAFARRAYGVANPLVGYPLVYQYLTSLRTDALPLSVDDLLQMRARGWLARYPFGSPDADRGVPLVTAFRWDTGVQVRLGSRPVEVSAAVTNGTLSNPRVGDDNGSKQVAARLAVSPSPGLLLGISGARGGYLSRQVTEALPAGLGENRTQRAVGIDVEYSRGYWLLRAEGVLSLWSVPAIRAPLIDEPLRAVGLLLEGRYRLRPGLYVAARADHLGFSRIAGTLFDGRPTPWDAPVSRIEVGVGYNLQRNIVGKLAYQHNWRDAGRTRTSGFMAAQLLYWF